jgi:hypothetical protein
MATLNELMEKFGSAQPATDDNYDTGAEYAPEYDLADNDVGTTKIASGGEETMQSLQDIFMAITDQDSVVKEAHVAAEAPYYGEEDEYVSEEDVDFAKMAEALADAETEEYEEEYEETPDIVKVASEYDAAGRIMARGFYDEFSKLAGNMDTDVSSNQMTESPSAASTPALGQRGLPTVETNFAGNEAHDGMIETAGQGGKQVYNDVLKPKKTISAGQGTGDDPEAMATSLGGGSPAGFATVRDLQA